MACKTSAPPSSMAVVSVPAIHARTGAQGSVVTPRDDARMWRDVKLNASRNGVNTHSQQHVDCTCVVELYELLWRWGNLLKHNQQQSVSFFARFGFRLPESVVFVNGKPYAWYFISRKDGALLRKKPESLTHAAVEKRIHYFCSYA